ncbi:MAG: hypothetical protein RL385_1008 [Pseudomonadota bacterium]|jgi:hypothetical protein
MKLGSRTQAALFALASLFGTAAAAAQDAPQEEGAVELTVAPRASRIARPSGPVGPLRVYGGMRVGFGGQFKDRADNNVGFAVPNEVTSSWLGGSDLDADPSIGFQFGVDYVLMDYFAIGGETRFNWVKVDGFDDRIMLWDLVAKPRGRYQLNNLPLELYATLPVGLSIANFDDGSGIDGGAGATLGLAGGANYFFNEHMGINAELGALFHWIHGEVDTQLNRTLDLKRRLAQCSLLQVNFVYAL